MRPTGRRSHSWLDRSRTVNIEELWRINARRKRRVAILLRVLFFAALLFVALAWAWRAHGAERVPISWTAPAHANHYEALARLPDGTLTPLSITADSAGVATLVPADSGGTEHGWVLVTQSWRAGAYMVWIRGCNGAGCAPYSNAVVVVAGIPDTLWHLERSGPAPAPQDGVVWKRAGGRVGWSLDPSDSVVVGTIVHQETVQLREQSRLCALYGFWCLSGAVHTCP